MGCSASKEAVAVVVTPSSSSKEAAAAAVAEQHSAASNTHTASTSSSTTFHKESQRFGVNDNNSKQQKQQHDGTATASSVAPSAPSALLAAASPVMYKEQTKQIDGPNYESLSRMDDWKVRPGYSSGASSYEGSDDDDDDSDYRRAVEDDYDDDEKKDISISRQASGLLELEKLREEIMADGDLAKTVVRIETPFDTPIEEIYDGVLDGEVLGSGVSGIVRLVVHRATGCKYAAKCLDLGLISTTEGLRQLRDEIFIMCQLDHPNIVRIEEVYESDNEIYIVQELCLGGDLFDRLDEQEDYHYTEAQCARLVKQMLSSVRYLHSKGIIHRDLKLENFLFSSTHPKSELKMIDFGLSKHFELGESHCEKVGTPYTVAPEIIQGNYDEKCDLWAIGVITYLLLCGETPFGGLDGESLVMVKENIMKAKVSFKPHDIWENVSLEAKAFVRALLDPDPKLRPTAKEMQRDKWIQVWAKMNAEEGTKLSGKTVGALMHFKESSDMQKLLSEVLSFTLLPEQIVDLRQEFEKMDSDGSGEISLSSLKHVLLQNAEAGALGALTEQEVEDIFDTIRVRKTEPTIRWHEFLAAGLSQARVDDRNLRLAFDRLDAQRKGFVTFEDLSQILGSSTEHEALKKIWLESLEECKTHLDRINFDDFKKLMKGQPKEAICPAPVSLLNMASIGSLPPVPEKSQPERLSSIPSGADLKQLEMNASLFESIDNPRAYFGKSRSHSYEAKKPGEWSDEDSDDFSGSQRESSRASLAVILPTHAEHEYDDITTDDTMSPLITNRAIYRKHREMRLAVLEASKQFDKKRNVIHSKTSARASLIMKRGALPPAELEDRHARNVFEEAAKRCGRRANGERHKRKKTLSDVTGMQLMTST